MFVFPQQCKDFREWLDRETAATEQWAKRCQEAIWEETRIDGDTLMKRTVTAYRAEAILDNMKAVQEALAAFEAAQKKSPEG